MSNQEQQDTGIPTRAIHETYLQMQHEIGRAHV